MKKAYVINLESRPDRLKTFMSHNFVNWFDVIEVVKAVDGATLIPDPTRVNPWNFRFLTPTKCKRVVACCMSHIMIWKTIVSEASDDFIVVFEDDAWPLIIDPTELQSALKAIPTIVDSSISFLWLNSRDLYPKVSSKGSDHTNQQQLLHNVPHTYTTEAYAIRPSFAKKLIEAIENDMGAIDAHMARYLKSVNQNYGLLYPLFYQKYRNDTDIQV